MKKMKLSEFKNLARLGIAEDITDQGYNCLDHEHGYEKIAYSLGVNGMNGGLIRGESGKLYVITARNSLLNRFF